MKKDVKAEMFQLLCNLTLLPLAKLSSITAGAGPSCWKPCVRVHLPKGFRGGHAGRMREGTMAWPHAALRRVCCHQMSACVQEDIAALNVALCWLI